MKLRPKRQCVVSFVEMKLGYWLKFQYWYGWIVRRHERRIFLRFIFSAQDPKTSTNAGCPAVPSLILACPPALETGPHLMLDEPCFCSTVLCCNELQWTTLHIQAWHSVGLSSIFIVFPKEVSLHMKANISIVLRYNIRLESTLSISFRTYLVQLLQQWPPNLLTPRSWASVLLQMTYWLLQTSLEMMRRRTC